MVVIKFLSTVAMGMAWHEVLYVVLEVVLVCVSVS